VRFIENEDEQLTIKLISDLVKYIDNENYTLTTEQKLLYPKIKDFIARHGGMVYIRSDVADRIKEDFDNEYVNKQIQLMMDLVETHPADAIGKSKELLESCFKHILDKLGEEYSAGASIGELRKQTFKKLNLDLSENVAAKNISDVKKILSSFVQIVDSLNSLRNEKGDGHGRGVRFSELPSRYAKIAVNSSFAVVQFTWDTFNEKYRDKY